MRKVALYDFDDTLLPYDSMARLIAYCLKKKPWLFYRLFAIAFLGAAYGLKLIAFQPLKEQILFPLKFLKESDLKRFYDECLIPHYYPEVVQTLRKHHEDGYYCVLVSASPESYLKYTDLPFDLVMGTKIKENTNRMISLNCKGEEKVRRIESAFEEKQIDIDYEHSFAYSDSDTDLPMLLLVKNRVRVLKHSGKMVPFEAK